SPFHEVKIAVPGAGQHRSLLVSAAAKKSFTTLQEFPSAAECSLRPWAREITPSSSLRLITRESVPRALADLVKWRAPSTGPWQRPRRPSCWDERPRALRWNRQRTRARGRWPSCRPTGRPRIAPRLACGEGAQHSEHSTDRAALARPLGKALGRGDDVLTRLQRPIDLPCELVAVRAHRDSFPSDSARLLPGRAT